MGEARADEPEEGPRGLPTRAPRTNPRLVDFGALEPPSWWERVELYLGPEVGRQLAVGALMSAVVVVAFWYLARPSAPPVEDGLPMASTQPSTVVTTTSATQVVVHAAGAVEMPGVYHLPVGSRVADLLDAAGGGLPDADLDRLNLAQAIVDGSQVYVPRVGEEMPPAPEPASAEEGEPSSLVAVNTASVEELESLPGVGPSTAGAIVEYREAHGRFQSIDELLEVSGIGEAKLAQIRDLVTLG